MAREWYYQQKGRRYGPVSAWRLRQMAASGQLRPTDLLWTDGLAQWSPAGQSEALFPTSSRRLGSADTPEATPAEETIVAEAVRERPVEVRPDVCATVDQSPLESESVSQPNEGLPTVEPIRRRRLQPSVPNRGGGFLGGLVYAIGFAFGLYTMIQVCGVPSDRSKLRIVPVKAHPRVPTSRDSRPVDTTRIHGESQGTGRQAKALSEVKALVEKGGNVNARDAKGLTPLHWSARYGYEDVAKFLIDNGADIDAKEEAVGHARPLHMAATYNHLTLAKLLLASGANVNSTDKWGGTPLQYAAFNGHNDLVSLFLANGAMINAKDRRYGITALQVAVAGGKTSTVELLLAKGADINTRNHVGESPVATALRTNHKSIARLLQQRGASR